MPHKLNKNKLILVEGLTGLGKSTLAHFLARQYQYNGIPAIWIHEGASPHPVTVDDQLETPIFMGTALERWSAFVRDIIESDQPVIIEANFFNNLVETLFTRGLEHAMILDFALKLQGALKPAAPALIYLTHPHIDDALAENFRNRGAGFQAFVLDYVTNTPIAQENGWHDYVGMITFWREFVSLTDTLFQIYEIDKLAVDVSTGRWPQYNRQVADFLSISLVTDPTIDPAAAEKYTGSYHLEEVDHTCTVSYQNQFLVTDLFMNVAAKLIPQNNDVFVVERWYFELIFEFDAETGKAVSFTVSGRDIDYLSAVGKKAVKKITQD